MTDSGYCITPTNITHRNSIASSFVCFCVFLRQYSDNRPLQHIYPERARREDAAQITPEVHAVQRTVIAVQCVRVGHERRAQRDGFLCRAVHHCQHVLRMAQIVAHERHRRHMVVEFLLQFVRLNGINVLAVRIVRVFADVRLHFRRNAQFFHGCVRVVGNHQRAVKHALPDGLLFGHPLIFAVHTKRVVADQPA